MRTPPPYKIYAENLEASALQQFTSALELDCVKKAALMPDAHTGYTLPIGAVVATEKFLFPSWVGYDIGCGMCALPTTFSRKDVTAVATSIHRGIHREIPVGFSHHSKNREFSKDLDYGRISPNLLDIIIARKARKQIGTLGGGNHFIEVGYGRDDRVWIIIHSGSRGVGHGTAQHYMRLASGDGKVREGHFGFHEDSEEGKNYRLDVAWCLEYALENRRRMVDEVVHVITSLGIPGCGQWEDLINRNHNHVEHVCIDVPGKEGTYHAQDAVWIHRKGATHAEKGMKGVIPGNMCEGSYIVTGKGNPDSLCSSSHGAGRAMSRTKAKATFNVEEFQAQMAGIVADASQKTLDECPGAYKDIHRVMELQTDLVHVDDYIKPILNVKG